MPKRHGLAKGDQVAETSLAYTGKEVGGTVSQPPSLDPESAIRAYRQMLDLIADSILLIHPVSWQVIHQNEVAATCLGYVVGDYLPRNFGLAAERAAAVERVLAGLESSAKVSAFFPCRKERPNPVELSIAWVGHEKQRMLAAVVRGLSHESALDLQPMHSAAFEAAVEIRAMRTGDWLTGLADRGQLEDHLEQALAEMRRGEQSFALLFIDLDDFKQVNDGLGHRGGDQVLRNIAHRFATCVRPTDVVARYGGDEFVILANGAGQRRPAARMARRLQRAMTVPVTLGEHEHRISASIGVAIPEDGHVSAERLLHEADLAMYAAKQKGLSGGFLIRRIPSTANAGQALDLNVSATRASAR